MLRRRLQQLSCVINAGTFSLLLSLLLAHVLLRKYLPNVATHGTQNLDFFFESDQEGDDQQHPPFVIDWRVVAGSVLAFLVSCAVDVGGLAGGGLLVPIFYQVVGFGLKASTGLSQAAIAGASAAALAANLFRAQLRPGNPATYDYHQQQHQHGLHNQHHQQQHHQQQHQHQQQPLVDLDLVLLLTPGLLLGVAVGAVMNDLLPEWVISAALVGVLWLSCHKTAVRGLLTWHAEAQAEASLAAAAAIGSAPHPLLRPILTTGAGAGSSAPAGAANSSRGSSPRLASAGSSPQQHTSRSWSSSPHDDEGWLTVATAPGGAGEAPAAAAAAPAATAAAAVTAAAVTAAAVSSSTPDAGSAAPQQQSPPSPAAAAATPPAPAAAASPAPATDTAAVVDVSAASDSDSSCGSSSPYGAMQQQQQQQQHSPPIYECTTKLLSSAAQQHNIHHAAATAAAAAGGRPVSRLARTGLYPGWFSPPSQDEQEGDTASGGCSGGGGGGGGGGPTAAWRPCSRSSSAGGLGYIITDHRLPAWQQQQQHGSSGAAAAAAAALQQQLQQLWLWVPPVHLEHVPWMKLFGLWAVWSGCMGLTALTGLLPFCSWAYVTYLLLFTALTGVVTVLLIQVLLVEPLLGARQVCLLSLKLQQFVHKHSQHSREGAASWVQEDDVEANQQQQQQHRGLHEPLLLDSDRLDQQQQQQQQGSGEQQGAAVAAGGAGAAGAVRAALAHAGWSASRWLHVLTGFGRAPAPELKQQQQQGGEEEVNESQRDAGDTEHLQDRSQPPEQQGKLSLFSQMRLKQQQQGQWATMQPPICPVAAATDSFFPTAGAAVNGQHDSLPRRVLAAAPAAADHGSTSRHGGVGGIWAGLKRVLGVQEAGVQASTEPLDPFDGNEQPWRYEEPFPVAPAAAAASPGPAPCLAAAAAAAAAGSSGSSSALVTIAAAAAVVSVAAGVLTGVTGVASSALFMPILLDFRVHTQVAMASTVVLVFLSSSAASLCFILQGRLIGSYAFLFALVGLCGGCVGVSMVGALLRLARRPSVVVLVIAGALAAAGLSCAVSGGLGFVHAWEEGHLGFRALCQQ